MGELWEQVQTWWEDDSYFRQVIMMAVITGAIGFGFVVLELAARRAAR